jgi:predicted enzyme related to lactoylglutathione lyase
MMGQPVVHFEVIGKDAPKLRDFYSQLAGWEFDVMEGGPTDYGVVQREGNTNTDGAGIGGGVGNGPEGYGGHVTFYIEVPDVGEALERVETLGGTKMMGPDTPMEGLTIGLFNDPEGHTLGLVQSR